MLKVMGFAEDAVVAALRQTNNDPDYACAWLMDSAGDLSGDLSGLDSDSSDDSLSRSMQAELEQGWPITHAAGDQQPAATMDHSAMATPAVNLNMSAALTPAPPGTEPSAGTAGQRGTSPVRRGQVRSLGASGFSVPPSVASTNVGDVTARNMHDVDEESFAIQRLPPTSPRVAGGGGSSASHRPSQPGSSRGVPARTSTGMSAASSSGAAAAGITPNNLFSQRTSSTAGGTGGGGGWFGSAQAAAGAVVSAAFSGGTAQSAATPDGGDFQRGGGARVHFASSAMGSSMDMEGMGADTTFDFNSSAVDLNCSAVASDMSLLEHGDTPQLLNGLQQISSRAHAAEEMAVALKEEVDQQMVRNEMLIKQLQDERQANAAIARQLRQTHQSKAAASAASAASGGAPVVVQSVQQQAERDHLAAFMARRLLL